MELFIKHGERITAILSTLVAVIILAVGVTAQQSRSARTDELVHLESDLRFQLKSVFRLNPKQGLQRVKQLERVLAQWRESERTPADRRLLADWLLQATIRSMPGSIGPLPAAPEFGQNEPTELPVFAPSVEAATEEPVELPTEEVENSDLADIAIGMDESSEPPPATLAVATAATETPSEPMASDPAPAAVPVAEASTQATSLAPPTVKHVAINLTELSARIAGYHRGLDEMEAALLTNERPQYERLARQIRSLDGLTKDLQFVRLYYESLIPVERQAIEPPRPLEATLAELYRHLEKLQNEVESDFLGEFDPATAEQLDDLRGQLEAIAGRVDW